MTIAHSTNGTHKEANFWSSPGPAAFDFRSDTVTTPNISMLHAIQSCTLMDDVFREDTTTTDLESHIAQLTSHEAALLVMSGTMGNQVALRSLLLQPPHSVLADSRSHVVNYEAGGTCSLSQAMLIPVSPSNGHHLTLEDVKQHAIISDDVHACPTRVISLENTLNGTIMPLSEVRRISAFASHNNIKMHLDGARLWECVVAGAGTLPEFTSCFDSVSLCFSKGLGAPIGSMLVGNTNFIKQGRRIRKAIGGGTRQSGVISAAARVSVDEGFGSGPTGEGGLIRKTHTRAQRIAKAWEEKGGKLAFPVETNMAWLDLQAAGLDQQQWSDMAASQGIKSIGGRLVVHYQITDEAEQRLYKVMDTALSSKKRKLVHNGLDEGRHEKRY